MRSDEKQLNVAVETLWKTAHRLDVCIGSSNASEWVWMHAGQLWGASTEEALAAIPKLTRQLEERLNRESAA